MPTPDRPPSETPYGHIITNDGVKLYYEQFGQSHGGPTVVLVHGWSGSRHYFDLNTRPLARTCRVVTYDQRFHGDSEKPQWVSGRGFLCVCVCARVRVWWWLEDGGDAMTGNSKTRLTGKSAGHRCPC
jgi:pimeloyl-ACP methyl ester carboxylesterase